MGLAMSQAAPRWPAMDADAAAVIAAFTTPPSVGRAHAINRFVRQTKAAGVFDLMDVCQIYAQADSQAARVDWALPSRVASITGSPTFTADRGFTGVGTAYLGSGYNPTSHAVNVTGTAGCIMAYERTNLATNSVFAGGAQTSSTRNFSINPRNAVGNAQGALNHAVSGGQAAVADSFGLIAYQRNGAGGEVFKNGVSIATTTPVTPGSLLVDLELYVLGRNASGVADGFRLCQLGAFIVTGVLTTDQHLALYNALQTYMTSVGAAV